LLALAPHGLHLLRVLQLLVGQQLLGDEQFFLAQVAFGLVDHRQRRFPIAALEVVADHQVRGRRACEAPVLDSL
jgi:hypothetical protein